MQLHFGSSSACRSKPDGKAQTDQRTSLRAKRPRRRSRRKARENGRNRGVSVRHNHLAYVEAENHRTVIAFECAAGFHRWESPSAEKRQVFRCSKVEKASADVPEEAVASRVFSCTQAKEPAGLADHGCGRQSCRREEIVRAIGEFRVEREMLVKIEVETSADSSAPLADAVQIIEVELRPNFVPRHFPIILPLCAKPR